MICRKVLLSRPVKILLFVLIVSSLTGCMKRNVPVQQSYPQDEFLARETQIGGEKFRYRVYVPANRHRDETLPIMLYLHGAGNRGDDNESQLNGLADQIEANKDKIDFIVVIPQCPSDRFWDDQMLKLAHQALTDVISEFNGDPDRLYAAGFSLGGYGTWSIAAMFPGKFAAIVPMSGRVLPRPDEIKSISPEIAQLSSSVSVYSAFAERIGNTPTWIFHGTDDSVVSVLSSRKMFEAMQSVGNQNVKFNEVAGAGHVPLAFSTPGFFEWLQSQKLSK